jgi:tRNA A-37 threonylcarbamoyl transferase component Bud32
MNKYKYFFTYLYDFKIIDNCKHKQKKLKLNLLEKFQNKLNKYDDSGYCVELLYDLKDGNLEEIINKLNKKQIYSMMIQLIYALHLMHKHNYYHNDIHTRNITYIKTTKKYLSINNKKIPTYGYIYIH